MIRGVLQSASRMLPPPGRISPAAGTHPSWAAAAGFSASRAAERAPLVPFMPAHYVGAGGPDPASLYPRGGVAVLDVQRSTTPPEPLGASTGSAAPHVATE